MPLPYRCTVPGHTVAFTWNQQQLCTAHQPPVYPGLKNLQVVTVDEASAAWSEFLLHFKGLFGAEENPTLVDLETRIKVLYQMTMKVEVYRTFGTLDLADTGARDKAAWSLRETISGNLLPYFNEDVESAVKALLQKADQYGRSLNAAQTLISYLCTLLWKVRRATDPTSKLGSMGPEEGLEALGNMFIEHWAQPVFGENLYLFPQIFQHATGRNPINLNRFTDNLLAIPAGYEAAETQYQAQLQHQVNVAQQAVAAKKRKDTVVGALKFGADLFTGANEDAAKARAEKEQRAYIRDRNYNAAQQAKRNSKSDPFGGFFR